MIVSPRIKYSTPEFIHKLKLATQYKKGDPTNPNIVKKLIKLSEGSGKGAGGAISHESLVDKVKNSDYFVAAELPLHTIFNDAFGERSYAGQADYLLYDSANKRFYIADYKPDLSVSDKGAYSFINSVPQIAIYALIIQKITGIQVDCLIFNSGGAMEFNPNNVLASINEFMQENIQSWVAPWEDFN